MASLADRTDLPNQSRIDELTHYFAEQMAGVKKERLGTGKCDRFVVVDGKLAYSEKIESCWDRFVECIIRIFCQIFGIKRDIQCKFEELTEKLNEFTLLTRGDDDNNQLEAFKSEYGPVVQDMYKAAAKMDKMPSCCMGGKAYPMDCLKTDDAKSMMLAYNVRSEADVLDSSTFQAIEENLRNAERQVTAYPAQIEMHIVINTGPNSGKRFTLGNTDRNNVFTDQGEFTRAISSLKDSIKDELLQRQLTLEPNRWVLNVKQAAPNYSLKAVMQTAGNEYSVVSVIGSSNLDPKDQVAERVTRDELQGKLAEFAMSMDVSSLIK